MLGELHQGAQSAQRRQEPCIRDLLTYAVLLPDHDTTAMYGEVKAELAQVGRPIPDNELSIAAVARQHDLPLATRDALLPGTAIEDTGLVAALTIFGAADPSSLRYRATRASSQ